MAMWRPSYRLCHQRLNGRSLYWGAFFVFLSACSSVTVTQKSATPKGELIVAEYGKPFSITLAENATTGYRWLVICDDDFETDFSPKKFEDKMCSAVTLQSKRYKSKEAGRLGQPGTVTYTFTAERRASFWLNFIKARAWELPAYVETKSYHIKMAD